MTVELKPERVMTVNEAIATAKQKIPILKNCIKTEKIPEMIPVYQTSINMLEALLSYIDFLESPGEFL